MSKTLGQLRVMLAKTPSGAGVDSVLLDGYINSRLREIIERNDWLRLIKIGTIQTIAPYETGTVALTNGVNTVTGTGTTFTSGMTGRRFRPEGRSEFYTFTYVSATSGTLDRVYEGDDVTGASFKIFKNIYAMPSDLDRIESLKVPRTNRDLDQVGREYLDERDPAREWYGAAEAYALADDSADSTPLVQIELFPIPDRAEGLPIRYRVAVAELAAAATKIPEWVNPYAIIYGVEADLYNLMEKPGMAQAKESKFEQIISGMLRQDAIQTEVEALQMNSRYTRHRAQRAGFDGDSDFAEFYYQQGE